jgi:putative redox protein
MAHAQATIGTTDYATDISTGHHKLTADEGAELGGKDAGPAPYDLLTSALGACTVITLLRIEGAVDDEQGKRMAETAERTPVTLTLKRSMEIHTKLA